MALVVIGVSLPMLLMLRACACGVVDIAAGIFVGVGGGIVNTAGVVVASFVGVVAGAVAGVDVVCIYMIVAAGFAVVIGVRHGYMCC